MCESGEIRKVGADFLKKLEDGKFLEGFLEVSQRGSKDKILEEES